MHRRRLDRDGRCQVRVQRNEPGSERGADDDEILEDEHGPPLGRPQTRGALRLVARQAGLVHLDYPDTPGFIRPK